MREFTSTNWKPEYTTNVQDLVLLKFFWFVEQSNKDFLVNPNPLKMNGLPGSLTVLLIAFYYLEYHSTERT